MRNTLLNGQDGLTLIEALAALSICSIALGIGLPQFRELQERWAVSQVAQSMASTLLLARSEAIQRGGNIGLRKLDEEKNGCQNAGTTKEWGCGWLVYEDVDTNGSWNSKKDRLLHEVKLPGHVNVMRNSGGNNIKFDRYGMANGLNANGFRFLPERTGISSAVIQTLCMTSGGRIRIVNAEECPKS